MNSASGAQKGLKRFVGCVDVHPEEWFGEDEAVLIDMGFQVGWNHLACNIIFKNSFMFKFYGRFFGAVKPD